MNVGKNLLCKRMMVEPKQIQIKARFIEVSLHKTTEATDVEIALFIKTTQSLILFRQPLRALKVLQLTGAQTTLNRQ